ncbi:MAG: fimbrillin family protein [Rikenellaceae bacterium]
MKKVFVFALAVAAFASCAKSEMTSVTDVAKSVEMKFSAYTNESLAGTRGTDADNSNIAADGNAIGIYAFNSNGTNFDASLNNHKLVSNAGAWESASASYWMENTVYNFYAYFPYVSAVATTDTQIITDYTAIPFSAASQTDILYTGVKTVTTNDDVTNMPAVALTFKHATSKVDFKFSVSDDSKVNIKSLRLEGLSSTHTGLALADGFANTVVADCSHSGNRAYFYGTAQNLTSAIDMTSAASVTLSTETGAGAFYLLPQSITPWSIDAEAGAAFEEGARLVINYTLTDSADNIIIPQSGVGTQDAAFPIPVIIDAVSGSAVGLQEGKSYVFTVDFSEDMLGWEPETGEPVVPQDEDEDKLIKFEVTVTDWVSPTVEISLN